MDDQRIVGDRYRLSSRLGRGGTADVYFGLDTRLCRPVAVKLLRPELAEDREARALFRREARFVGGLQHPNLVAVYDAGETADPRTGASLPYLVLEYVPGQTLQSSTAQGRAAGPTRALRITRDLLDALGYCHAAGVVHHDVKPANVIVALDGRVKLMDFGIARLLADGPTGAPAAGEVRGTAKYMAPERLRGDPGDARADLYSVGVLLYQLAVGRPPFVGDEAAVLQQQLHAGPVAPSVLNPALGPDLDAVLRTALAKAPAERYASAAEMRAAVQGLLDHAASGTRPAAATPAPVAPVLLGAAGAAGRPPRRWAAALGDPSRRRALVAAGVAAALVPMAGLVARTDDLSGEQVQASVSTVGRPATEVVEEVADAERATTAGQRDSRGSRPDQAGSGSVGTPQRDLGTSAAAQLAPESQVVGRAGATEVTSSRGAGADRRVVAAPAVDVARKSGADDRIGRQPVAASPRTAAPKPRATTPSTRPEPARPARPPKAAPRPSTPPRGGSPAPRPVVRTPEPAQERPETPKPEKVRPHQPPRPERPRPAKPEKAERDRSDRGHDERDRSDRSHDDWDHGDRDRDHDDRDYGDRDRSDRDYGDRDHGDRDHDDRDYGDQDRSGRGHGDQDRSDRGRSGSGNSERDSHGSHSGKGDRKSQRG